MKRKRPKPSPNTTLPPAAQRIANEIGEERLAYIMNHRGKQKRSITARRVGLSRYRLNEIHLILFGAEAI